MATPQTLRSPADYRRAVLSPRGPRKPLARLVLVALVHLQEVDPAAPMTWQYLERATRLSRRAVEACVDSLLDEGWIALRPVEEH